MNKQDILDLVQDIASETIKLKDKYIDEKDLKIDYLTIFSHSGEEFIEMQRLASTLGEVIDNNNGPVYRLFKPIKIPTGQLQFFRVRHPDPERPQKGCDDFAVSEYQGFKKKYLGTAVQFSLIVKPEFEMIEIKDLAFDVLTYFPNTLFSKSLNKS